MKVPEYKLYETGWRDWLGRRIYAIYDLTNFDCVCRGTFKQTEKWAYKNILLPSIENLGE